MRRALLIMCLSSSYLLAQQPDPALLQRYSEEGQKALAERHYAEAEEAYEKLVHLDPGSAEVRANLGLVYFQEGKFAQAIPPLREALKLKPSLPNADTFLAMSLSELGHYEEAISGLQNGFRRVRDSGLKRLVGLHLERAYTGLRRDREAVEVALELSRLYPDDPEVLYQTGRLCGNFSYLAIQRLVEVAPESIWRHQASGELFESQGGHYDLAIREYRIVLELDPGRPGIHYRLGRVLMLRSQEAASKEVTSNTLEAQREFEQELQLDPTNANAAYELGELYRKSGRFDKARELFDDALKYYPDFEEAQLGLSRVLIAEGKPDVAVTHLRKAVSLDPEDDVGYFQLSQAYKALGDVAEQRKALAEFQRLRSQKARHVARLFGDAYSPHEVTKQELDSEDAP